MISLSDTLIDTELKDNRSINKLHMFLSITNPITASYNCSADRPGLTSVYYLGKSGQSGTIVPSARLCPVHITFANKKTSNMSWQSRL